MVKSDNTYQTVIILPQRKPDKHYCTLCGVELKLEQMRVGGYLTWVCDDCAEKAKKAVDAYLRWLTYDHVGISQLVSDLKDALDKLDEEYKTNV